MTSKMAQPIEEQQEPAQDYESSIELDPFSLFINAMSRPNWKEIPSMIKYFF